MSERKIRVMNCHCDVEEKTLTGKELEKYLKDEERLAIAIFGYTVGGRGVSHGICKKCLKKVRVDLIHKRV
jgi:hypothetical protein